jgi:hypothetical protein
LLHLITLNDTHTHTHTQTLGRTPLDEESVRRRDLYLTTQNTHKKETSMPPAGFEPAIRAREQPQTHVLDRAATGIGRNKVHFIYTTTYFLTKKKATCHKWQSRSSVQENNYLF